MEIWWNPDSDPCNCNGNERYDHTEYQPVVKCIDYGQGGDGGGTGPSGGEGNGGNGGNNAGGGGTGPDNPGNPGNPGSPGGPGTDPNINWLYPPGSFVTLGDHYGTYSRPGDWVTELTDYWDEMIAGNFSDFNATNLLTYGANRGWAEGIVRNRKCGKLFEEQALKYFGFPENKLNHDSPLRKDLTTGSAKVMTQFRPDHIDGIVYDWTDDVNGKYITTLSKYFLTEVKATSGILHLSTSNYQIQAEVDFLKRRKAEARAAIPAAIPIKCEPIYFLITTADATIGNDIIQYEIQNHLWIWTSYSKYKIDPVSGSPVIEYTWPVWVVGPDDVEPRDEVPFKWLSLLPSLFDNTQFGARHIIAEPDPNFDTDPEEVE